MEADDIIKLIEKEQLKLLVTEGPNRGDINDPVSVSKAIVTIRMFLVQLVDKVADAELEFKRSRAARYDKFITSGMKKSPAVDALKFEQDLIEKEIATERVRNYMKYVDSLVSAVQTLLKVQASGDRGQF